MVKRSKTGRRWCFSSAVIDPLIDMEEIFKKEKRVRYAIWCTIKKEESTARGYIELRTPLKQTGILKILGSESAVHQAREPREDHIKNIAEIQDISTGPFSYGQRELNKGGRPRTRRLSLNENEYKKFFILSSYIDTHSI